VVSFLSPWNPSYVYIIHKAEIPVERIKKKKRGLRRKYHLTSSPDLLSFGSGQKLEPISGLPRRLLL